MRPCVRYLMAAANLTAARPQDVSSLGLMDILNSGLYCAAASGPAGKRPAVTMRRLTLHFMATPSFGALIITPRDHAGTVPRCDHTHHKQPVRGLHLG